MRVLLAGLATRHRDAVVRLPSKGFTLESGRRIGQIGALGRMPDVVLLECEAVDEVALDTCVRLRSACDAPIVTVTGRADTSAWLRGHDVGIDDFLVDPFGVDELAARLRIAVRPALVAATENRGAGLVYGPLHISEQSRTVTVHGSRVQLRPKEYRLLVALTRRAGQALSRQQLIDRLWPAGWEGAERALEAHVHGLRRKLAVPGLIATVRGVGYRLISQESYLRLDER
ncbi:response regulator transcription factor [Streptomyces sp. NPDC088925]|uniref:response regulator transcription factor n=1 Tax=Streptomyces sp. NPDC088925 TaxID=3365914 RepID=UPI0038143F73